MSKPKYVEVIDFIRENVDNKKWDFNKPIPTERKISETMKISRSTVRKSINILIKEGYLISEHGRGTFIMPQISRDSNRFVYGFSKDMARRGLNIEQQIIEFDIIMGNADICKKLNIDDLTQPILYTKRLRLSNGKPVGLQNSYVNLAGKEPFTRAELEHEKSLYSMIYKKYGWEVLEAEERISAAIPTTEEQELLQINADDLLLFCKRTTISNERRILEYCEMQYPTKRYEYKSRITRSSF